MIKNTTLTLLLSLFFNTQAQQLIKDIYAGVGSSDLSHLATLSNGMLFMANNPEHGNELWISDGTPEGTHMLIELSAGSTSTKYTYYQKVIDSVFYIVIKPDADSVFSLWRTNGEAQGTYKLLDYKNPFKFIATPNDFFNQYASINHKLYFVQADSSGNCLCEMGDQQTGKKLVYRFNDPGVSYDLRLTEWHGSLYFFAHDSAHGIELWQSDGTTAGTKLIADIYKGKTSSVQAYKTAITTTKDYLYFAANRDSTEGFELFKSDGSLGGTDLFIDFTSTPYKSTYPECTTLNDKEILVNTTYDPNIYLTDGTPAGTKFLKFDNNAITKFKIKNVIPFYNSELLYIEDNVYGGELRTINRLNPQIELLKDINPGPKSSDSYRFTKLNNQYYFIGFNNNIGTDIWTTDGTFDNTFVTFEISEKLNEYLWSIVEFKNKMYASAFFKRSIGLELYNLDSKLSGITPVTGKDPILYPNPIRVGEELHLPKSTTQIKLYNTMGQLVWQSEPEGGKCQIPQHLSAGLYHLFLDNNTVPIKIILQ